MFQRNAVFCNKVESDYYGMLISLRICVRHEGVLGVDVYIRIFLTLPPVVSGQLHTPAALTPWKEYPMPIG
jgi:hypothetical protein